MAAKRAATPRRRKRPIVAEPASTYSPRRILLDTHAWLWWYTGDRRLGRDAQALIKRTDEVRFSAASAWEIAIKRASGKLVFHGDTDLSRELERDGFTALAITVAHADAVRRLPHLHRDPFDRMLVAQSQLEGLTIVTADDVIPRYGVAVFDARE
jgi:PIN domain nuclease of toxin-antitoxin system